MKNWIPLVFILFGCGSGLEIDQERQKLVIEGEIEAGQKPRIYLTLSSGYYDPVDSINLLDLIVTTARVAISDGENEEVLTLYRNKERFPPYYYEADDIIGEVGKTYSLEVISRGETYTATTTILPPKSLDSLWFEVIEDFDTLGNVWISFYDDLNQVDYYRIQSQVVEEEDRFVSVYQGTISDRNFNDSHIELPIYKGAQSFTSVSKKTFYHIDHAVNIRFCVIDKASFDFWKTLEREQYLAGNPFGSSGNEVTSNISGTKSALGVWSGCSCTYYTIDPK